ncbi:MAG TPA: acyl-CoA dehydrogenase family protein [Chloroflexota bacterium]|jgi:alkylation response protein AidB-like acyl-CoA dehydrogenase|nr:acyl-CoA dehydrogenase family protein [Chloroflexota bacterium]
MDTARQPDAALIAAAQALVPRLAAAGDEIERTRRLPDWLVEAMRAAGLFRMLVPDRLGGAEAHLATFAASVEALAVVDGSTAWCLSQGAGSVFVVANQLAPDAAAELVGDPACVVAWGPGATGVARPVAGGHRVAGRWSFASGCHHATWLGGAAVPSGATAEAARVFLFPAGCARILDTWHVSGLRGTGSDTYEVEDVFVPEGRSFSVRRDARHHPGPLYAFPPELVYGVGFASVALGIARGALDAFVGLAAGKTPRNTRDVLRESAVVQAQHARAEAAVRSARAFLREAIGSAWTAAAESPSLPLERRAILRLAVVHAIHAAAAATDSAYQAAGATAIFESNPFERRFRDVHAVTQQIQARPAHFETVGRFLLGLPPEPGFL